MSKPKEVSKRRKTSKQKKVPDYNHDMIQIINPFTKENTASLIQSYNLYGEVIAVCEQLNNIYKYYCCMKHADDKTPKTKQQKEYINEIESSASRLRTLIEKMSHPVAIKLIRAIPTDPNKNVFGELKDRLLKDLKELENRAFFANHETPKDKGGKPSNKALKSLFWRLADIYEEHTNCTARVKLYKDSKGNPVIKGKFFDFLNDVINIAKLSITEDELKEKASTIRDVLKKRINYQKTI